ncbi:hypothetical protein, partial [Aliikangiella maris]
MSIKTYKSPPYFFKVPQSKKLDEFNHRLKPVTFDGSHAGIRGFYRQAINLPYLFRRGACL